MAVFWIKQESASSICAICMEVQINFSLSLFTNHSIFPEPSQYGRRTMRPHGNVPRMFRVLFPLSLSWKSSSSLFLSLSFPTHRLAGPSLSVPFAVSQSPSSKSSNRALIYEEDALGSRPLCEHTLPYSCKFTTNIYVYKIIIFGWCFSILRCFTLREIYSQEWEINISNVEKRKERVSHQKTSASSKERGFLSHWRGVTDDASDGWRRGETEKKTMFCCRYLHRRFPSRGLPLSRSLHRSNALRSLLLNSPLSSRRNRLRKSNNSRSHSYLIRQESLALFRIGKERRLSFDPEVRLCANQDTLRSRALALHLTDPLALHIFIRRYRCDGVAQQKHVCECEDVLPIVVI